MSPSKKRKLVLFGDSAFAEIAYEYFTHDSDYEVAAFTVSETHRKRDTLFGLPIIPFEQVTGHYPPGEHDLFVALVYRGMNQVRADFYRRAKAAGYRLASYVSSRAFLWRNVKVGDNSFVFENNVVQPFAEIGSNTILWSGNHVGHHSRIGDHCFLASHVVISGFVSVGDYCFLGVNATVADRVKIGERCLVGAGALVVKDAPARSLFKGTGTEPERNRTTDDVTL